MQHKRPPISGRSVRPTGGLYREARSRMMNVNLLSVNLTLACHDDFFGRQSHQSTSIMMIGSIINRPRLHDLIFLQTRRVIFIYLALWLCKIGLYDVLDGFSTFKGGRLGR